MSDCVGIVEALYALELEEGPWLAAIARAAADGMGVRHCGAYALTYDASDIHDCRFLAFAATDTVDPKLARLLATDFPAFYRRTPAIVEAVLRRVSFAPSRELRLAGRLDKAHEQLGRFGVHQILGLNGVNVDGRGAHIGLLLPEGVSFPDVDLLARLSSHLAAASRLRRRLAGSPALKSADAVIEPTRAIVDAARGVTLRDAREALAPAVALLSRRERQVVALAALGHANKTIAYELGIAISTVGVLLGRAARKFGATKRAALLEAYGAALSGREAE